MLLHVTIRQVNSAPLLTPLHSRSFNEWPLRAYQRGKPKCHLLREVHVLSSSRTAQFSDVHMPISTKAQNLQKSWQLFGMSSIIYSMQPLPRMVERLWNVMSHSILHKSISLFLAVYFLPLNSIHISLEHPISNQLRKVINRFFFVLVDEAITNTKDKCHSAMHWRVRLNFNKKTLQGSNLTELAIWLKA